MIKSNKHIKAIELRDKLKKEIQNIHNIQFNLYPNKPEKRVFPPYMQLWYDRLLNLEYLIIDYKYGVRKD